MLGAKIQNVIRQIDNAVQTPNGFNPEFLKNVRAVITSYSIHYTKLYDNLLITFTLDTTRDMTGLNGI